MTNPNPNPSNGNRFRFRAWHKERKEMSYGFDNSEGFTFNAFDTEYFIPEGWSLYEMVIMQSTGLHDKNGKMVFEGDILLSETVNHKAVVVFDGGSFCVEMEGSKASMWVIQVNEAFEIIGNIHESPSLLKDE